MLSIVSLVVLACAVTINAQNLSSQCNPMQIGIVPTSKPVKLQPVSLAPMFADWKITIPHITECLSGVAGVQAFACDGDVAPSAFFSDFNNLMVHRNGNLQHVGSVSVTVYCNY